MAGRKKAAGGGTVTLDLGSPNEKQRRFLSSRCRYTAYGGARGGGKSWAVRAKAIAGALRWPGAKFLILRRTYPELENTMIDPLCQVLSGAAMGEKLFTYYRTTRTVEFLNGSVIRFGHLNSPAAIEEYQGQEYDWIFMDEATQFTQWEFRVLCATLRGVNDIPKRMYLTCNPGGVGHEWVKRLFIDRSFTAEENPQDYAFIPATVEDNTILLASSPGYLQMLDLLPDDLRAAHRFGNWEALAGRYFGEFSRARHVVEGMVARGDWTKYRAIDYGLDMFACLWVGVDERGRAFVYREVQQPGLIVSDAAALMLALTPPGEEILATIAPPDLWSTLKDTGRTMEQIFAASGTPLVKASNSRVQGWMTVKEFLKPREEGVPGLLVDGSCTALIAHLQALQHHPKNPSDCATQPHHITHICDALRYFAQHQGVPCVHEEAHKRPKSLLDHYLYYGMGESS